MAVNVLPGRGLETPIAVGCGTAVDTAPFIMVVLMESIDAFGTARTVVMGTAMNAF